MKEEIIKRIFGYFVNNNKLFAKNNQTQHQVSLEIDDQIYYRTVYGATAKIGASILKVLGVNISADSDSPENVLIFKMDDLSTYALTFYPKFHIIKLYVLMDTGWIELTPFLLAKVLVGIEQLDEMLINYELLAEDNSLFKSMMSFLKYEQENNTT